MSAVMYDRIPILMLASLQGCLHPLVSPIMLQGFAAVQVETLATAHALYSDKTTLQKLREAGDDQSR